MLTRALKRIAITLTAGLCLSAQPSQYLLTAPTPPGAIGSAVRVGAAGTTPVYYWIVTHYPAGTVVSPIIVAINTVGALNFNTSNYVTIAWVPAAGATTYDVIRDRNAPNFPGASCTACAVATGQTGTAVNDQGAALSAYALGPQAATANAAFNLNNTLESAPYLQVQLNNNQYRMLPFSGAYTAGDYIQINANGIMTDSGVAPGSSVPGGATGQVQYKNGAVFGGITGATTNGTVLTLVAPILGTPASVTLTNATGLPLTTGVVGTLPAGNLPLAAADGVTLGISTYTANDFNAAAGLVSLDYVNGQKASTTLPGFLSAADWSTFNGKGAGSVTSVQISGTTNQITVTTCGPSTTTLTCVLSLPSTLVAPGTFAATASITNSGLTSGRVVYSTTAGLETDSANLLFSGTALSVGGCTVGSNSFCATTGLFSGQLSTADVVSTNASFASYSAGAVPKIFQTGNAGASVVGFRLSNDVVIRFTNTTSAADTVDTGLSRDAAAGVIDFGTGAQGSTAGSWKALSGTLTQNAIAATPTDSLLITNTTAAAAGVQQYSPALNWTGQGWGTTTPASETTLFRSYVVPVQGTTHPSALWNLDAKIGSAAAATIFTITSVGNVQAGFGSATAPSHSFIGRTGTGMYSLDANTIGFAIGGTDTMFIQNGNVQLQSRDLFLNSTATAFEIGGGNVPDTFLARCSGVAACWAFGTAKGNALGSWTAANFTATGSSIILSGLSASSGTPSSICAVTATGQLTINAALTCTVSNEDVKNQFLPLSATTQDFMSILPAQFEYNDTPGRLRWGFGAKQVASVNRALADGWHADGTPWSLDQNAILALTVKTVQEQQRQIAALQTLVP